MKPHDFTVEHNTDGAIAVCHVQPVSRRYCTDYDLENYPNLPYHCQWVRHNYDTLCSQCLAFRKQVFDEDTADDLFVERLPECLERERIVAQEAAGQMTIEEAIANAEIYVDHARPEIHPDGCPCDACKSKKAEAA
jgi:hypothetical protein